MSKCVLVMDMPENCKGCRFSTIGCQDNDICYLNNKEIYLDKKPDWCPLRDLPEKDNKSYFPDEYSDGYKDGYNACIDELLKGKEE